MKLRDFFHLNSNPYNRVLVYYKDETQNINELFVPIYEISELEQRNYEDGIAAAHALYAKYWDCNVLEFKSAREFGIYFEDIIVIQVLIGGPHG